MSELLFSYGTLQKEKVQLELFGKTLHGLTDVLSGYRTVQIEIKDQAVLSTSEQRYHLIAVPSNDKNDFINGIVLELTEEELHIADEYETEDYKRIRAMLESGKESWVYVAMNHVN
jgi:gamma-glutamylcyclotransferase (GGCT)/AIG2-like uncharacterized protein YtfP